jgi:hypothetical protein
MRARLLVARQPRPWVGATARYKHGMGTVLRCPSCDTVLIRVAEIKGRYWLDMRGLRALQLGAVASVSLL